MAGRSLRWQNNQEVTRHNLLRSIGADSMTALIDQTCFLQQQTAECLENIGSIQKQATAAMMKFTQDMMKTGHLLQEHRQKLGLIGLRLEAIDNEGTIERAIGTLEGLSDDVNDKVVEYVKLHPSPDTNEDNLHKAVAEQSALNQNKTSGLASGDSSGVTGEAGGISDTSGQKKECVAAGSTSADAEPEGAAASAQGNEESPDE